MTPKYKIGDHISFYDGGSIDFGTIMFVVPKEYWMQHQRYNILLEPKSQYTQTQVDEPKIIGKTGKPGSKLVRVP